MKILNKYRFELMCSLFLLWALVGVFPLSCYETDSMHIIAGCNNYLSGEGDLTPPCYSYEYDMQPLVTVIIVGIKKIFGLLTCEQIYCLITSICALFFAWGSLKLIAKITGYKKEIILLTMFLLPETYACAYYPNSTTLSAAFYIWGLLFFANKRWILSGILLCLAPLFRIDILIVYPAIFPLMLLEKSSWKSALLKSAAYAIAIAMLVTIGCIVLKANPINSLLEYNSMNDSMAYASGVKFAIFTFYTAMGLILFPIGFLLLVKDRTYLLLFFCLLPIGLLHFMFRNIGCATKHYLYLIPFVIPMIARTLQAIFDLKSKKLKLGIYSCIFLFLICSIRIDIQGSPWRNRTDSEAQLSPFIKLCSEDKTILRAKFGVGTGQLIPTLDEFMLASGNTFYPFYISTYKKRKDKLRREAYEILKDKDYKLLMLSWGDKSWFVNLLLEDGWKMVLNKKT